MDITFTCPHCHEVTPIGEEFVGQSGECRACGKLVTVDRLNEKPPPMIIADEPVLIAPRPSSGLFWKFCVVLAVLFLLFVVLMLPAVSNARMAARRMSSASTLKQLALAMHNYHDYYHHFPRPYLLTAKGERTLSWRMAIIPFLDSSPRFDYIHPEEAWNSPTNRELASFMPPSYRGTWNLDESSRETAYLVVTGPGTLFEEDADHGFADCIDGLANTIMVVEVKNSGIEWNEPRDLDIRTMIMQINASDSNGISAPWKEGAQVAMADGSVKFLSSQTLESTLRAMITRGGGEQLELPK